MILKLKVLCAVLALVYLCRSAEAACPTVQPMANFSAARFLGAWYLTRRYSTVKNGFNTACVVMNATKTNLNVFNIELCNFFSQRTPGRILGTLLTNGVYDVKYQVGRLPFQITYYIVDTDYTNYAVVYFCATLPFAITTEVGLIYSRTRTITAANLATAVNALKGKNLNLNNFRDIDQSPGVCT